MTSPAGQRSEHLGPVSHTSNYVWCADRQQPAVVSVIGRDDAPIRFVLWCSLRACGECSERCVRQFGR